MRIEEPRQAFSLNDRVTIRRWRVSGTVIARSYSPLRYDIQCAKKIHRNVPAEWVETAAGSAPSNVIHLAA